MTALPDTIAPTGPILFEDFRRQPDDMTGPAISPLRNLAARVLGVTTLLSAIGVWLIPVMPGDAVMQLVKLALSMSLLMGGITAVMALRSVAGPEIQIDPKKRCLNVIERGAGGRVRHETSYRLDSLSELVLRDNLLTARDAFGRPVLALPVNDARAEAAIRAVLADVAA